MSQLVLLALNNRKHYQVSEHNFSRFTTFEFNRIIRRQVNFLSIIVQTNVLVFIFELVVSNRINNGAGPGIVYRTRADVFRR